MWKLKKGAAVVAIVAIALHSVITDARQLQQDVITVAVDPCDFLKSEMKYDGDLRCQSVRCLTLMLHCISFFNTLSFDFGNVFSGCEIHSEQGALSFALLLASL